MKRVFTTQQQQPNSTGRYGNSTNLDICTTEELGANRKKQEKKAVKGF